MGAWDVGPFGNDEANDWAHELVKGKDVTPIEVALDDVLAAGAGELPSPLPIDGLAACEALACLLGRGAEVDAYTEELHAWAESMTLQPSPALRTKALLAVDRVLKEPSELRELWEETPFSDAWFASVADLRRRLEG